MSKQEFLDELRKGLSGIPQADIEERVNFYSEMIDDRIEEGLTEEEAVKELGPVQNIIAQIMSEIPLVKIVKENVKAKRSLSGLEILLLVLGSPIWLTLLLAVLSVVFGIYAVIFSLLIAMWAVEFAVAVVAVAYVVFFPILIFRGNLPMAFFTLGLGLVCAGLANFGYFGCKQATKGIFVVTKKLCVRIKSCFVKKEAA